MCIRDRVTTSAYAKSMGGSQVFLEEGETQDVEIMIKCIVIASGNDASVAMAEHIGGSEQEFVRQMNERAAGLGMENTHFVDCCGLTESTDHYTTVRDIAIMSRELITKYPKILEYSSIWKMCIRDRLCSSYSGNWRSLPCSRGAFSHRCSACCRTYPGKCEKTEY